MCILAFFALIFSIYSKSEWKYVLIILIVLVGSMGVPSVIMMNKTARFKNCINSYVPATSPPSGPSSISGCSTLPENFCKQVSECKWDGTVCKTIPV